MKDSLRKNANVMRRKPRLDNEGDTWLLTFSDVITLLLAFFVMILNVSDINQGKVEALKEGLSQGFNQEKVATPLNDLKEEIQQVLETYNNQSEVVINDKGVNIEFSNVALYQSANANIQPSAISMLQQLAEKLKPHLKQHYIIDIQGHTDDVPIHNATYDSNWELSANRATNIVKLFVSQGINPEKMKATGFADSRPKTTDTNLELNQRRAQNRRVVIEIRRQ